jgi:hypothetical protein
MIDPFIDRNHKTGISVLASPPPHAALQNELRSGARMLEILMRGVSTRQSEGFTSEMVDTVGSESLHQIAMSRNAILNPD